MAEKRPALGRGLSALIPPAPPPAPPAAAPAAAPATPARPTEIDIDLLTPNPRQPRTSIDEGTLEELAQSIRSNGVIQPILVRPSGSRYEIVAGERRWRAAQRAGLLKVPVTIRDVDDANLLQVALIENIQREDLNPIEEAQAYRRLADELQLSQESIAGAVGKDRATVANYVRLLRLPAEVRNDLASNALSMGHARALLGLADGEAAENEALAQSAVPRGLVRLAVPMTFGVKMIAPLLPGFLAKYPDVSIDLHLSDAMVDLIGEGFDAGLRIASLPDSSLVARRLCAMPRYTVASPAYLKKYGTPTHPMHLAQHRCFGYAYLSTPGVWHYTNAKGEQATVRPSGPLRVNNGEAVLPSVLAGLGIADLPEFIVGDAIAAKMVQVLLKGWKQVEGAVHLVMPPGGPRPARVEVLIDYLAHHLARPRRSAAGASYQMP